MATIAIEPRNPLAWEPEELRDLEQSIRVRIPVEVGVQLLEGKAMRPGARGVTFWELILVHLNQIPDDIRSSIVDMILLGFGAWAGRRFKRKPPEGWGPDRRPKHITIQAEDGTVIIERVIRVPGGRLISPEAATRPTPAKKRRQRKATKPASRAKGKTKAKTKTKKKG
jgi:hypothetical protein